MNVAERIVSLRTSMNITTNKLANMAGISQSYLRDVELGIKNPTVEMLRYICDALGISLQAFFFEEGGSLNPFLLSALEKLSDNEQMKLAEFINEIKKYYGDKLLKASIPRAVKLSEAPSFGEPINYHDKYSKANEAYEAATTELLRRIGIYPTTI